MAQDFAKQRSIPDPGKRRRAVSKTPPPGNANWSWFFSGLMSGIIISIAAYLGMLKLEEGAVEEAQATPVAGGPENQPTYSFYEVLTQAEVPVNVPSADTASGTVAASPPTTDAASNTAPVNAASPPDGTAGDAAAVQTAAVETKPDLYLLQAGSFQNRQDAENQRARIILLNLNANIAEGIVGGRTHYRVQVGPFAGRPSADSARSLLAGSDIESIFLRVPQ
ncbi:MAG: SPOR domain-containing protein [Gammaproteobacteria bacterium]